MTCKAWLLLSCMAFGAGVLTSAAAPLAAQEQGVNGTNVARVEFNQGSVIQKVAPGTWMEYDPAGNPTNRFEERSRDEWSVYLYDPSRNLRLAVDLLLRGQVLLHARHLGHAAPPEPELRVHDEEQRDQQGGDEAAGHDG